MPYLAKISLVNQALIRYYEGHTLQDSFPELTTTLQIPYNHINRRGTLPYIYIYLEKFHFSCQKLMKTGVLINRLIVCRIFHFVGLLDWPLLYHSFIVFLLPKSSSASNLRKFKILNLILFWVISGWVISQQCRFPWAWLSELHESKYNYIIANQSNCLYT